MLAIASQIILCLVLAALIGLIIGYLLGKANCPKNTYKAASISNSHTHDDGDCGDNSSKTEEKTSQKDEAHAQPQGLMSTDSQGSNDEKKVDDAPSDADKPTGLLDAPRDGKKDNLTRIKGVGKKIDETLNSIGIYHFDQIAAWTEKEATWIDNYLSFPGRSLRDDWVGQAKLLAEGKETEFSKRVDAGEVATSKKS